MHCMQALAQEATFQILLLGCQAGGSGTQYLCLVGSRPLLQDARRVQQWRWWKGRGVFLVLLFGNPKKNDCPVTAPEVAVKFFFKAECFNAKYVLHWNLAFADFFQRAFGKQVFLKVFSSCMFRPFHAIGYPSGRLGPLEELHDFNDPQDFNLTLTLDDFRKLCIHMNPRPSVRVDKYRLIGLET